MNKTEHPISHKTIGVTGGGYVGSAIIEELLRYDCNIVCMDNFHNSDCSHLLPLLKNNKNFKFVHGDINNKDDAAGFCDQVNAIFNTAAIVGFPACDKHPELATRTHTDGIKNLLRYRKLNCPFVQFSTDSCYGINDEFCTEETKLNPQSLYGETKKLSEEIVLNEYDSVVLRFSTGMGISQNLRIGLLVHDFVHDAIYNGKLEVFEPNASRSFIHVNDMAKAAIFFCSLLTRKQNRYSIYNIGSDSLNISKGNLAKLISYYTDCDTSLIEGKDKDCRNYKISHNRATQAGFLTEITLEETIQELIKIAPIIHKLKVGSN